MKEEHYLFVYGTLRSGFQHPVKYEIRNDIEWAGEAQINARIYDIGRYPGAVRVTDGKKIFVRGEVYRIRHPKKVFRILDEYEGFHRETPGTSEYVRDQELIFLPDGRHVTAWVYWYNFRVDGKRRIRHKDYVEYLRKKEQRNNNILPFES